MHYIMIMLHYHKMVKYIYGAQMHLINVILNMMMLNVLKNMYWRSCNTINTGNLGYSAQASMNRLNMNIKAKISNNVKMHNQSTWD